MHLRVLQYSNLLTGTYIVHFLGVKQKKRKEEDCVVLA
jgi:hypothetical protein